MAVSKTLWANNLEINVAKAVHGGANCVKDDSISTIPEFAPVVTHLSLATYYDTVHSGTHRIRRHTVMRTLVDDGDQNLDKALTQ
jgi:hypothetical protein